MCWIVRGKNLKKHWTNNIYGAILKEYKQEIRKLIKRLSPNQFSELKKLCRARHKMCTIAKIDHITKFLIGKRIIRYDKAIQLEKEYRARNPNIWIFEISDHKMELGVKCAKKLLIPFIPCLLEASIDDNDFNLNYTFTLNGIRIRTCVNRATRKSEYGTLVDKALHSDTSETHKISCQRLWPSNFDVAIFILVYVDKCIFWVASADEIENSNLRSKQTKDSSECKVMLSNHQFNKIERFRVDSNNLHAAVNLAYNRKSFSRSGFKVINEKEIQVAPRRLPGKNEKDSKQVS